jgi:hypothetical protein
MNHFVIFCEKYPSLRSGSPIILPKTAPVKLLFRKQDIPRFFRRNFYNPLMARNKPLLKSEMVS